jgi:hypothetical protein
MTEFATRISRVRMKQGADIHVLHNAMPDKIDDREENWRGKIIEHARNIAGHATEEGPLDGFVVIGFFADGASSVGFRVPARIPAALLPGYVSELLRRDTVTSQAAANVFDEKFIWTDQG